LSYPTRLNLSYIFGPSIRNQSNPKRQHLFSGGQRSGTDKWYLWIGGQTGLMARPWLVASIDGNRLDSLAGNWVASIHGNRVAPIRGNFAVRITMPIRSAKIPSGIK
ncbi:MAG TPA: hypothetical protein DIS93_03570, partial [Bdellovibrionales bacterium]|nr:hypothetical protein [Bdellovibrionales bacterium]